MSCDHQVTMHDLGIIKIGFVIIANLLYKLCSLCDYPIQGSRRKSSYCNKLIASRSPSRSPSRSRSRFLLGLLLGLDSPLLSAV